MQYIFWLIFFVWIPTVAIWTWQPQLLWKYRRTLAWAMFWSVVFSLPWDIYAVQTKIWFFPPEGNWGVFIYDLPIEEILFMTTSTLMVGSVAIVAKYRLFPSNI